jgi:ubiquinone/menaquinone biosynthesis C-methylase UbiE
MKSIPGEKDGPSGANQTVHAAYGRLAPVYSLLEHLAFGRSLHRARTAFLEKLGLAKHVAVFGGGDGRVFERLLQAAPLAQFDSYDVDPRMTEHARRFASTLPGGQERVRFICADAMTVALPAAEYDGHVTAFFLDCFTDAELPVLVERLVRCLKPDGLWIMADFNIPPRPTVARLHAKLIVSALTAAFRLLVGHRPRVLPQMDAAIRAAGFGVRCEWRARWGLLRAAVYQRN